MPKLRRANTRHGIKAVITGCIFCCGNVCLTCVKLEPCLVYQIHYPKVVLVGHSKYFGGVICGWVLAVFNGSLGGMSPDKSMDNAVLSPELLFPNLDTFARKNALWQPGVMALP